MSARDTIVAVATPPGVGGVGVIRISGERAVELARTLLGRAPRARHAHYAVFRDADGETIDRGLLIHFAAPRSYTGEHVVELQTHGSAIVLRRLVARIVALGARHARPGEFSERAFLNGKLDLAQAEAVADLVAAGSETAARAALRSLEGDFSRRVHALTEAAVRLRVWIEAAIDFPEEEIDFLAEPTLHADLAALRADLADVLAGARRGVRLADGLHVVIAGRPNVGKSSLLNALAASDRAIVTDVPGTTRDLLRETIELDGIAITLVDTAGLRDAADVVEQEGIRRARAELARADAVLLVVDDAPVDSSITDMLVDAPPSAARIVVRNKIDLADAAPTIVHATDRIDVALSARTGAGLDLLRDALKSLSGSGGGDGAWSARARHVAALERGVAHLAAAEAALAENAAAELAAEELRHLQRALGEITGEFTRDDLLGEIFGSFCIGK